MNLKQRMCVEQGDYKASKVKYYKWLTFLSNGLLMYLEDTSKMIHLKTLPSIQLTYLQEHSASS